MCRGSFTARRWRCIFLFVSMLFILRGDGANRFGCVLHSVPQSGKWRCRALRVLRNVWAALHPTEDLVIGMVVEAACFAIEASAAGESVNRAHLAFDLVVGIVEGKVCLGCLRQGVSLKPRLFLRFLISPGMHWCFLRCLCFFFVAMRQSGPLSSV